MLLQWISAAAPPIPPAGWALVKTDTNGITHQVYSRLATGTDPGSTLVVVAAADSGSTSRCIITLTAYANASSAGPVHASAVKTETTSQTTHSSNTVSTTITGKVVQFLGMKDPTTNSVTHGVPTGYTKRLDTMVGPSFAQVAVVADSDADAAAGTVPSVTFTSDQATVNASVISVVIAPLSGTVGVRPATDVALPAGASIVGGASQAAVLSDDDPNTYVQIPLGAGALDGEVKFGALNGPLQRIVAKVQCDPGTNTLSAVFSLRQGATVIRTYTALTTVNTSGEALFDQAVSAPDQAAQTTLSDIRVHYSFTGS